jgi:hypothetical protein
MPVDGSLLNPQSGAEMARDLESKGRHLMRSYVRLRMRLVVQRVTLPEKLEQSAKRAFQEVQQADPMDASADYGRKLDNLQWMMEDLENGLGYSEPQQLSTNISQQHQPPHHSSHAENTESSAGPEGEEAQEGDGICDVLAGDAGVQAVQRIQPGGRKCIPQKHGRDGSGCRELDGEHEGGSRKRPRRDKSKDSEEWIIPATKPKTFIVRYVFQRIVFEDARIPNDKTHARFLALTCGDWSQETLFSAYEQAYPQVQGCRYFMNNGSCSGVQA